jgi:hypothetical protein
MKKLALLLIVLLVGCSGGLQVQDDTTNKVLAYAAGKMTAIGIYEVRPQVDAPLTDAWESMMDRNAAMELVSPMEMVAFFNECSGIIAGDDFDKYGLVNDLLMLLTIYGADFADGGKMAAIDPVPMDILKLFALGYANGRSISNR